MANTFKNTVSKDVGTSPVDVYTTPSSTTSTIIGVSCSNTTVGNITVDVEVVDTSAATAVYLGKDIPITVGSSLVIVGGDQKLVLETTDILRITSSASASIDVVVSLLEST